MAQFNLFIMRPCGGDDQGRGWQIVHRQSGEHILAPSAAAATAWLVGRVEAAPARVVAELDVRPDLCTAGSIMHGGAYMAFADSVGAYATVLNMPKGAMTTTCSAAPSPATRVHRDRFRRHRAVPRT